MTKTEMVEELMEHELYLASIDGAYLRDWFRRYFDTMDPEVRGGVGRDD